MDKRTCKKVKVKQATKDGFAYCKIGGLFNARFPDSTTRRGRVIAEGDISPTIVCCGDEIVRIESMDEYRIRKLTPTECGRLMNVNDRDIGSILSVNSNSQGYKQFGNSIVVAVLIAVFSQLHIAGVKTWNEMTDDERYSLIYKDCEVGR